MNTTPPEDYNPHVHGHSPRSRVERLAWAHRESTSYDVRRAAASVLVMAGCLRFHACAVIQAGDNPPRYFRRRTMATAARKLRRHLSAYTPRNTERGVSTWMRREVDEMSDRVEAQSEGRLLPKGRPCHHG